MGIMGIMGFWGDFLQTASGSSRTWQTWTAYQMLKHRVPDPKRVTVVGMKREVRKGI